MDWEQEENATKLTSKKEYDCVICNQTTPSSEDKPMGLVVLVQVITFSANSHSVRLAFATWNGNLLLCFFFFFIVFFPSVVKFTKSLTYIFSHHKRSCVFVKQATSIIGHERQQSDRLVLPTSDDDPPIPKADTRSAYFDRRMDEMNRHFDPVSQYQCVH